MLFCHVITVFIVYTNTGNYCIILVLQLSFYNSDLIFLFDIILPCSYCCHSVHPYWKMNVLFLSNRCLSHLKLSQLFLTVFMYSVHIYWKINALFLSNRCLSHQQFKPQFPYFCYSVHPYRKIIVLFLSYSPLSNITTQI